MTVCKWLVGSENERVNNKDQKHGTLHVEKLDGGGPHILNCEHQGTRQAQD